ncbi:UDP-N-acetylmuramoyl-L-alanyl-D-glutamate--2,6-diaminopimelate ligase [Domibacillus epiphyticus]|uniref:UDP-N-acetylmuramyl-tripeptide synthetase n=1 Tax=Domibacillus epiphyticus TaxID=1714355 RepID=A0A1V2A7M5_9BACI|nr:UDP-N-acetylmuramoyl-L-alanyl-D-glutamate--2,6-diaminopimelate ligase [Domibacillus epiphyticus]OMP66947.1 UDP-N-acetylmuramoyl-L-alanyl-D-glutamate--2,6-diaminopimelate ligase [Domibacillus epiphyticus]
MKLHTLLENVTNTMNESFRHIEIEGISTNSASVRANELFVAIPGYTVDGHEFIRDAIKNGTIAIVGEKDMEDLAVPYIKVASSRKALAEIASQFYGNPSRKHTIIGITGTNGKTTTAFMLKHILESNNLTCSLFGSVMNIVNGQISPSVNTTLDALELQRQLSLSHDDIIIMEVSSHGLTQYRVQGIEFDYCLFTNLDQDHLDYHRHMDEYFAVKARLFDQLKPGGKAIINVYNSWGKKLYNQLQQKSIDIFTLGDEEHHDLRIGKYIPSVVNSAEIYEGKIGAKLNLLLLGKHNIFNASMAYLTARKLGIKKNTSILQALETFHGVPGRFELFHHPKGAVFVVDYAHTANALINCLQTAREYGANRIFHIFGFRGNRDKKKRKEMVRVSHKISDLTILTLDDLNDVPIQEMERDLYVLNQQYGMVIPDRTLAIKHAWEQVQEGDWVMITGKGSETYQQPFQIPTNSDKETLLYLNESRTTSKTLTVL